MNRMPTVILCVPNTYVSHTVVSALTGAGARCTYYEAPMDMLRNLDSADEFYDYVVVEDTGYGLAGNAMLGEMVNSLAPSAHVFLLSARAERPHGFDKSRLTVIDLKSPASDICFALTDKVSREFQTFLPAQMVA